MGITLIVILICILIRIPVNLRWVPLQPGLTRLAERVGRTVGAVSQGSRRLTLALVAGAALGFPGGAAQAQVPGETAVAAATLSPVVVTGTRNERPIDETPVRTEVIDHEEIERTGAITLKDALENLPGVNLTEVHGKSGYQISMQGFGGDQVLVLIDGLPLTSSTSSTADLSQYLLVDVDRIEVVKGPASALYGSAAMGGVVNVITRPIAAGWSGRIEGDIGSRGSQNASGRSFDDAIRHLLMATDGGSEHWRWRVAADALRDSGFSEAPSLWPLRGDKIGRNQYLGRLEWLPVRGSRVFVEASRYEEDDEQRYNLLAPPRLIPQRKTEAIRRDRVQVGGDTLVEGWRGRVAFVDERFRSDTVGLSNEVPVTTRDAEMDLQQFSVQLDAPLWRQQLWQVGLDWHRDSLAQWANGQSETTSTGDVARRSIEAWLQGEWLYGEDGQIVGGLRWQDDSDFGSHIAPKLGWRQLVHRAGDWRTTLRASIGQGYRVPNLKERHYLFDHSALGYVVLGNPDLQPERSTGQQLGLVVARGHQFSLDLNLFHNLVRDLIQTDTTPSEMVNGVSAYRYRNVARARTAGLEVGLQWRMRPGFDWRAGYTYTHTRDRSTGLELTRRPRQIARLGFDWLATDDTTLSVRTRWQSDEAVDSTGTMRSPAWSAVDLTVQHRLNQSLLAMAGVRNLFDKQRRFGNPEDLSPKEGRLIFVGLRYRFGPDGFP